MLILVGAKMALLKKLTVMDAKINGFTVNIILKSIDCPSVSEERNSCEMQTDLRFFVFLVGKWENNVEPEIA